MESAQMTPGKPSPGCGSRPEILILGIGNILLRDEGVGVRVVEALRERALPEGIEALDGGTSGAGLVDEIADRRKVIAVDSMQAEAEPGAVFRLGLADLLRNPDQLSLHEFGLLDTLMMAKRLGCLPREIVIFGIQPKDIRTGLDLSPEISALIPGLIDRVLEEAARPSLPG
jgi:hydrogenase maturation protease